MYEVKIKDVFDQVISTLIPQELEFTSNFMQAGNANFKVSRYYLDTETGETLFNQEINAKTLNEWNRVEIYYTDYESPILVWEGWAPNIQNNGTVIEFECVDFWSWIERKKCEVASGERTYTEQTFKSVLETEWGLINDVAETGYEIECNILETFSPTIQDAQSFQQLLREVIDFGYEVEILYPKIKIATKVGNDYTGADGKKLLFSYEDANNSNMARPSDFKIIGSQKINRLIAKGKNNDRVVVSNFTTGEEVLTGTKLFEKYNGTTVGSDLELLAQEYLAFASKQIIEFDLTPYPEKFKVGELKVGDEIVVEITDEDPLFDVNANYRITAISSESLNHLAKISVSERKPFDTPLQNILNRLKRIEQKSL